MKGSPAGLTRMEAPGASAHVVWQIQLSWREVNPWNVRECGGNQCPCPVEGRRGRALGVKVERRCASQSAWSPGVSSTLPQHLTLSPPETRLGPTLQGDAALQLPAQAHAEDHALPTPHTQCECGAQPWDKSLKGPLGSLGSLSPTCLERALASGTSESVGHGGHPVMSGVQSSFCTLASLPIEPFLSFSPMS